MPSKTAPIAVYDSGVGGLAITMVLQALLPQECFHYIGDTEHLPYGEQTTAELCSYIKRVVNFCLDKRYKLLVIACNTATAAGSHCLPIYLQHQALNVINVIDPVIASIAKMDPCHHIGLIGTSYTMTYSRYTQQLASAGLLFTRLSMPLLAPMVESYFSNGKINYPVLYSYLSQLAHANIDSLIPACTHYLFLQEEFKKFFRHHYQKDLKIIDVAHLTALAVKELLITHNLLNNNPTEKRPNCFMATELTPAFKNATQQLFGQKAAVIDLKIYE